jgi:hypothetical protein
LIEKLERMGIRGICGNLIADFLSCRPQHAKILEHCSPEVIVNGFSCPQGTVTSPTLFNLFINDMLRLPLNGCLTAYADDTALLCTGESVEQLFKSANEDFLILQNWLNDNGLTLNKSKTVYIEFNVKSNHTFTIEGIECVTYSKYLGVIIDKNLRWDYHCNLVASKIRQTFHKFLLLRRIISLPLLKSVYFALVDSHLCYGIMAWGGAAKTAIDPVEKAQKKVLKIMFRKPALFPSVELFKLAEVFNPRQIFVKQALTCTHLTKNSLTHPHHSHNTRWLSTIPLNRIPTLRKTTDKQATQTGIIYYNLLPPEAKHLNLYQFKNFLKKWVPANIK